MAFSLSDHAGPLGWLGAALVVNVGLSVAIYRGWVRAGGRFQTAMTMLASLLGMRATMSILKVSQPNLSGGPEAAGKEDAARNTQRDNYMWLAVVAVCFLCIALISACVVAKRRRRARGRALPRPPARRGNFVRRA